jgi:diguanylate cyclase (GGDEF)-like protein
MADLSVPGASGQSAYSHRSEASSPDVQTMRRLAFGLQSGSAITTALLNNDLSIAWVSESVIDLLGRPAHEFIGTNALDLLHPDEIEPLIVLIANELQQPASYIDRLDPARIALNRLRFKHPTKHWVQLEMSVNNETGNPDVQGFVLHFVPCQLSAASNTAMTAMLERKPTREIIALIGNVVRELIDGAEVLVRAERIVECTSERLRTVVDTLSHSGDDEYLAPGYSVWHVPAVLDGEIVGSIAAAVPIEMALTMWTRTALQQLTVLVCHLVRRDQMERRLSLEAACDPLTGLANRRTFFRHTETSTDSPHAVIYVDLDGFKAINDEFGHEVGDAALIEVGHRITNAVRPGDLVSRFGGDEFTVWTAVEDEDEALRVAERIRARLVADPLQIGYQRIDLQATIGVAVGDALEVDSLLRRADLAMVTQKQNAKGVVVLDRFME